MQIWLTILASWPAPADRAGGRMRAIGGDHRLGAGVGVFLAAAHHGEHAVLRAGLSARDRRVDEAEPELAAAACEFARDLGGGRGVVDEDPRPSPCRRKRRPFPRGDGAQVVVVADAGEDEVLSLRRPARGVPPCARL
jgi:hypothetical protein